MARCTRALKQWKELITGQDAESVIGCIFEVDLAYPESVHDGHRDLPLASEHYNCKLCTVQKYYVVHVQNLQYYMNNGMELVRVNRVTRFHQKPMKPYMDFNTVKRAQIKTPFGVFYRLTTNIVFGKTMENVRKRHNVKLCDEKKATKLARQPRFARFTIFDEDFLA